MDSKLSTHTMDPGSARASFDKTSYSAPPSFEGGQPRASQDATFVAPASPAALEGEDPNVAFDYTGVEADVVDYMAAKIGAHFWIETSKIKDFFRFPTVQRVLNRFLQEQDPFDAFIHDLDPWAENVHLVDSNPDEGEGITILQNQSSNRSIRKLAFFKEIKGILGPRHKDALKAAKRFSMSSNHAILDSSDTSHKDLPIRASAPSGMHIYTGHDLSMTNNCLVFVRLSVVNTRLDRTNWDTEVYCGTVKGGHFGAFARPHLRRAPPRPSRAGTERPARGQRGRGGAAAPCPHPREWPRRP